MPSKVSASSFSSSRGPLRAMRSCSVDSESRRAVLVIACSGRSMRPASSQASPKVITAMMARARSDLSPQLAERLLLQLALAPRRAAAGKGMPLIGT